MIDPPHLHEPGMTWEDCRQCNPYPQYVVAPALGKGPQTLSEILTTLPSSGGGPHSHPESDVTNLTTDLAAKAATSHAHAEADVTGLTAALAGKAATHSHPYAATSHSHVDGDLPAGLARDAEVTSAIATHAATPHGGTSEAFPVGSVFVGVVSTNPATLLGYGTWAAFGAGRVLIGRDTGQSGKDLLGAATHAHAAHSDHAALTHAGATVGNHSFTQPSAHSDHAALTHSAHSGSAVGNHAFTQPGAHSNHAVTQPSDHANNIAHTHGLNVQGGTTAAVTGTHIMTSTATGGSARAITAGDAGLSSGSGASLVHAGTAVDAHSAHTGGAVDAHAVTQPSAHSDHGTQSHSAHSGGAVDAHSVGQANQHAAQSHSAHDSVAHLPPSIVVYLWERTA